MALTLGLSWGVWGAILWPIKEWSPILRRCIFDDNHQPNGIAHKSPFTYIYSQLQSGYSFRFSTSSIQRAETASEGILQSPRGERLTLPTLGPSGTQERLNCWEKKRR